MPVYLEWNKKLLPNLYSSWIDGCCTSGNPACMAKKLFLLDNAVMSKDLSSSFKSLTNFWAPVAVKEVRRCGFPRKVMDDV